LTAADLKGARPQERGDEGLLSGTLSSIQDWRQKVCAKEEEGRLCGVASEKKRPSLAPRGLAHRASVSEGEAEKRRRRRGRKIRSEGGSFQKAVGLGEHTSHLSVRRSKMKSLVTKSGTACYKLRQSQEKKKKGVWSRKKTLAVKGGCNGHRRLILMCQARAKGRALPKVPPSSEVWRWTGGRRSGASRSGGGASYAKGKDSLFLVR